MEHNISWSDGLVHPLNPEWAPGLALADEWVLSSVIGLGLAVIIPRVVEASGKDICVLFSGILVCKGV